MPEPNTAGPSEGTGRAGAAGPDGVLVVGASAGGVEALRAFVVGLDPALPVAVLVVLHLPAGGASALPAILARAGSVPVRHAEDGDVLRPGQVLVAPPDHHLVVLDGRVSLTRGPQENGHRPAVDVLFRTAARTWGARTLGLVLSGALDDGAAGAVAVAERGGTVLVQDFEEALYSSMPRAAAAAVGLEGGTPMAEVPRRIRVWLDSLTHPAVAPRQAEKMQVTPLMETETGMAQMDPTSVHHPDRPGAPAGFGCPDCAGSLFGIEEGSLYRFRCRVGHAWSPESLLARQAVGLESALWMALRSLEEKAALNGELGERAASQGQEKAAARFAASAADARQAAELVRQLVVDIDGPASVTAMGGASREDPR